MKAFAYLRVSGKGQIDDDGFPGKLAAIEAYSKSTGIARARVFREKGVSGSADGMDRPAWVEMIGCVLANGVKNVVIERLDRLARDLMIQEHILQDLQRRGITLISVAEADLCSDDPSRKLMRQIMGAIAEYDRRMVVLKLRGARQRMRSRDGRCEGAKPSTVRALANRKRFSGSKLCGAKVPHSRPSKQPIMRRASHRGGAFVGIPMRSRGSHNGADPALQPG